MTVLSGKPKYINPVTLFYKHSIKYKNGRKKILFIRIIKNKYSCINLTNNMQNLYDKSYSTIEGNNRKRENGNPCRILDRKIHYNSDVIPFPNPNFYHPAKTI